MQKEKLLKYLLKDIHIYNCIDKCNLVQFVYAADDVTGYIGILDILRLWCLSVNV